MTRKGWTVVVAGNHREFEQWCRDHRVNLKMLHEARVLYASAAPSLRGLHGHVSQVIYTGTWHIRELELLEAVQALERGEVQVVRS